MAPDEQRRRASLWPLALAALGAVALGAVWLLWPVLRAVAILAVDAVVFAALGAVAYFYVRRLQRRRRQAAEKGALASEAEAPTEALEAPPPAEQPEEVTPPEEEPAPPPVPERDRAAEIETKLQAIKRRLGKKG